MASKGEELWKKYKSGGGSDITSSSSASTTSTKNNAVERWNKWKQDNSTLGSRVQESGSDLFDRYNHVIERASGLNQFYKNWKGTSDREKYRASYGDMEALKGELSSLLETDLTFLDRGQVQEMLDNVSIISDALSQYEEYYSQGETAEEFQYALEQKLPWYQRSDRLRDARNRMEASEGKSDYQILQEDIMAEDRRLAEKWQGSHQQIGSTYLTGSGGYNAPLNEHYNNVGQAYLEDRKDLDELLQEKHWMDYVQKYTGKEFEDDFLGQTSANYTMGRLSQDSSLAWNAYLENPTEANRRDAETIDQLMTEIQGNNQDVYADDGKLPWLSKTLANYIPQFLDQMKYSGSFGAAGALTGNAQGVKAGMVLGSGAYSYMTMRGAAFKSLLEAGVPEEQARAAAKDEAVVSSLIEMGDTAIDLATLGGGKLINVLSAGSVDAIKNQIAKGVGKNILTKLAAALANYGINIGSEWLEEATQESVSIANQNNPDGGIPGLVKDAAGVFFGSVLDSESEEGQQIREAGAEGAKIAAMMGGVQGVTNAATARVSTNYQAKQAYGSYSQELIQEAKILNPDSQLAEKLQGQIDSKKDLSGRQIVNMVRENQNAFEKQVNPETTLEEASQKYGSQAKAMESIYRMGNGKQEVGKFDRAYKLAYEMGKNGVRLDYVMQSPSTQYLTETQRVFAYQTGQFAAKNQEQTSNVDANQVAQTKGTRYNEAKQAAQKYGDQGQVFLDSRQEDQDLVRYDKGFQFAYNMGMNGGSLERVMDSPHAQYLTEDQKQIAYQAGQAAQQTQAGAVRQGMGGKTNGREETGIRLRQGVQRSDGQNPGGQVRSVEGGAGSLQVRQEEAPSKSRTGGSAAQEASGRVSARDLGLPTGSTRKNLTLVSDEDSTPDIQKARAVAKEKGMDIVLFKGGSVEVEKGGKSFYARAFVSGDKMFVRTDQKEFTAEQLARHEAAHRDIARGKLPKASEIYDRLVEKYGANGQMEMPDGSVRDTSEFIDWLIGKYAEAYNMTDCTPDEVFEEIVCDSMAGMNAFGEDMKPTVEHFLKDIKAQAEQMGGSQSVETTGPGEVNFSRSKPYWKPKLTQAEWNLLNYRLNSEFETSENYLNKGTKWLYAESKGTKVFAYYGIGDGSEPTVLYAIGGKKAEKYMSERRITLYGGEEIQGDASIHLSDAGRKWGSGNSRNNDGGRTGIRRNTRTESQQSERTVSAFEGQQWENDDRRFRGDVSEADASERALKNIKFSREKAAPKKYTYEWFIQKPDMVVTTIGDPVTMSRADIVNEAKKNAVTVGKGDPNGTVTVHVRDTDMDVIIGRDGLKHSIDRRLKELGPIILKAGEILQNSIKINELLPKKADAVGSYVLIGAARNPNGDFYVVRSVVNRFQSKLVSMDVLYAINAKKEAAAQNVQTASEDAAALNAPIFTGNPLYVTAPTISISELLENVNAHFPDVLPEDVLKHFGHDRRPDGELGESALYSRENPTAAELQRENALLKERLGYGKGQVKKGVVKGEGVQIADLTKTFNDPQRTAYKTLSTIAEATGIDIVLYKSQTDADGKFQGAQGKFKWNENAIYIDVNAGLSYAKDVGELSKYTMLRACGHEITHFIEKWAPEEYNELRSTVFNTLTEQGMNVEDLIDLKMAQDSTGKLTYDLASREVVAESMTDILRDSTFVEQLAAKNRTLFDTIRSKIKEFLADIKRYFSSLAGNTSREAKALQKQMGDTVSYLDDIVKMFDQAAVKAVEQYQSTVAEEIQQERNAETESSARLKNTESSGQKQEFKAEKKPDKSSQPEEKQKKPKDQEVQQQYQSRRYLKDHNEPDSAREWSVFNRSFANKTSRLKPGERANITIYTADNVYFVEATGYMEGTIVKKMSLNKDIALIDDFTEEFKYGTELGTKGDHRYDAFSRRNLGGYGGDYVAATETEAAGGNAVLAGAESEGDNFGYYWESVGFNSEEELIEAVKNGALVMDDNGDLVTFEKYQPRTQSLTDQEILEIAADDLRLDELTEGERDALQIFRDRLTRLNDLQEQRADLGTQYRQQQFGANGQKVDRAEAEKTRERMKILDSQIAKAQAGILDVQNKAVLRKVLQKARKVVETKQREKDAVVLSRWRDRRNNAEEIQKYRKRIAKDVKSMTDWVINPSNKDIVKHIPDALKNTVIPFLTSIDFTSKRQLRGGDATKTDADFIKRLDILKTAMRNRMNDDNTGMYSGYTDLPPDFMERLDSFLDKAKALTGDGAGEFIVNRMTASELKDLSDLVRGLKKLVQDFNRFHANAMYQHVYDAAEATQELISNGLVDNENEAYWKIREWDADGEYSRYDSLYQAARNGQSIQQAMEEFTSHGYTEKEVLSKLKSQIGTWYEGGEISKQQAVDMLEKYMDMDSQSIDATVNKWSSKVVTGIAFEDIKEEFLAGNLTARRAAEMYVRYGGYTKEDAQATVKGWQFEQEWGFAYSQRKSAYKSGQITDSELRTILMDMGGKTAEEAEQDIAIYDWEMEVPGSDGISYAAIRDYYESVEPYGVTKGTYTKAWKIKNSAKGVDADGDGKKDAYSVVKEVFPQIGSLPISAEQKDALAHCWWADSTVRKYKTW